MGIAYAVPTVAGPLLGGFFTDTVGWRWAFWMNIPLSALAIFVAATKLPVIKRSYEKGSFDLWGALALAAALSALTLAISLGGTTLPWNSPIVLGLLAITVAAAVAFARVETRAAQPIMTPLGAALAVTVQNGTTRLQLKGVFHAHVTHEGLESLARKRKHPVAGKTDEARSPGGTIHEAVSGGPALSIGNLYHTSLRREALQRSIDRRLAHALLAVQKVVVNLVDRKRLAGMP